MKTFRIFTSSLSEVNKSLTISTFPFSTAICNAAFLKNKFWSHQWKWQNFIELYCLQLNQNFLFVNCIENMIDEFD